MVNTHHVGEVMQMETQKERDTRNVDRLKKSLRKHLKQQGRTVRKKKNQ